MRYLAAFLLLAPCAWASCTGASPTWTTTPDQTSVNTCISNASNGDTINVSAGTATWTSLSLSKAVTLNGAGQGVTSGSDATAAGGATTSCTSSGTCIDVSGSPSFTITLSSSGNIRIKNFAFTSENATGLPHPIEIGGSWPPSFGLIWQNDTFTANTATMIDDFNAGGVIFSGITFNGNWNDFFMTIKDNTHYSSWESVADTMGSRDTTGLNNTYFENSTVNGGSNGIFDCDDNCRVVVRYNTFNESGGFNSHGDDSSPVGMRHFEIYSNAFNFPDQTCTGGNSSLSNISQYIWLRGGTGVIYNNSFAPLSSSCWGDKPEIRGSIRGIQDDLAFLPPTYTSRIASCGAVTYPAPNQLGQNFNGTSLFTDPIYVWGNTGTTDAGGFKVEFNTGFIDFGGGANPCSFTWSTFFQWGRDAVNTSVGTNTCDSTGCSVEGSGGTAKAGYTAFTYPHPLVSGGAAPSNFFNGLLRAGN